MLLRGDPDASPTPDKVQAAVVVPRALWTFEALVGAVAVDT